MTMRAQGWIFPPASALVTSIAHPMSYRTPLRVFCSFISPNSDPVSPWKASGSFAITSTGGPPWGSNIPVKNKTIPLLDGKDVDFRSSSPVRTTQIGSLWSTPQPKQMFVALARSGKRYIHDITLGATPIRAVVSDLDGTLLGSDGRISARTLEAIRKVRAKEILFIPASGRSTSGMFSSMGELGQDLIRDGAPFISMNGLTVYGQGEGGGHGEIVYSTTMCPKLALRVVDFWKNHPLAEAAGVSLCGSCGDKVVVERLDERTRRSVNRKEPKPEEVWRFKDAIADGMELNRLYFWGPSRVAVDALRDDLDEHLKDYPKQLTRGIAEMIEVLPPGSSKAVGLKALLGDLGISMGEVVALGDEDNDVEMLRAVEHSVAMGQASLSVRRAARYTAPSNVLDGVAVSLETFCGV